jgi:hypothetical protein
MLENNILSMVNGLSNQSLSTWRERLVVMASLQFVATGLQSTLNIFHSSMEQEKW